MTDKKENQNLRSPLSVARGLGSTHDGTHHWMQERITSIAGLPLMVWLVWSITHFGVMDYASFTAWLAQPVNAVLMILSIVTIFYHAFLGIQVVVEDYVHGEGMKFAALTALKCAFIAAMVACVFSILKIAFSSSVL